MHSTKAGKIVAFIQELSLQKTILFFILFFTALQAQIVDGIAILVKEEPITLYDIEQRMAQEHLSVKRAADALVREKLESMEIKERGLEVTATEVQERIAQIATQNNMSKSQLYDVVWQSQHLSRGAFEEKLKQTMLTQKLYQAVAMNAMEEPGEEEMQDYYRLHPEKFSQPDNFEVTVYTSTDKNALAQKMQNPMLFLAGVTMQNATLPYAKIEPKLAELLVKTDDGAFTPILPDPKGGYVAFYVRGKSLPKMLPFQAVKMQVQEALMAEEREQTLKDHFERARLGAEIKVLRLPQ